MRWGARARAGADERGQDGRGVHMSSVAAGTVEIGEGGDVYRKVFVCVVNGKADTRTVKRP